MAAGDGKPLRLLREVLVGPRGKAAVAVDHVPPVPEREVHVLEVVGDARDLRREGILGEHDIRLCRHAGVDGRRHGPDALQLQDRVEIGRDCGREGGKRDRSRARSAEAAEQPPRAEACQHGQADRHDRARPRGYAHASDRREPAVQRSVEVPVEPFGQVERREQAHQIRQAHGTDRRRQGDRGQDERRRARKERALAVRVGQEPSAPQRASWMRAKVVTDAWR